MFPVLPELFSTLLTPKAEELVATPYRFNGNKDRARQFFEHGLGKVFERAREVQDSRYPMSVFYAFKQEESEDDPDLEVKDVGVASTGWETMLEGMYQAGFSVTGTWPIRTELTSALKGSMNALASSIVLTCRPRPHDAQTVSRKEFIGLLRSELPNALRGLQHGNIAPVDLAQAAIGPGMAVFTRYAKVIESEGAPMSVRTALGIINQVLDEVLAEQEGDFDPDTRWALAWYEQFGTEEGPFGVAETLSRAKNTAVNGLVEARVVKARAGKVQLVGRSNFGFSIFNFGLEDGAGAKSKIGNPKSPSGPLRSY
jgi:putative DNA methylase